MQKSVAAEQPKSVPQPKQVTPPTPPTPPKVQQTTPQPKLVPKQVEQPKPKFVPKSVDQPKLAPKSVDQPKLAPKSVDQPKFAPKSVDQPKLAPKTVDQPEVRAEERRSAATCAEDRRPAEAGTDAGSKIRSEADRSAEVDPNLRSSRRLSARRGLTPANQIGNVNELRPSERKRDEATVVIVEPGNRRSFGRTIARHLCVTRTIVFVAGAMRASNAAAASVTPSFAAGGYEVITITDAGGRLLRRFRRGPDGREIVLIDNRPRITVVAVQRRRRCPARPGRASHHHPARALHRRRRSRSAGLSLRSARFTADRCRSNAPIRSTRSATTSNCATACAASTSTRSTSRVGLLGNLARPDSAIGGDRRGDPAGHRQEPDHGHHDRRSHRRGRRPDDNLSLSDRRAEAVAETLTTHFDIPPENLVTQGYGEQHLRVQTDGPSRENRRVQVRNITGLMAGGRRAARRPDRAAGGSGQPPG